MKMDIGMANMPVSENIRRIAKQDGRKYKTIAQAIGWSKSHMSDVLYGRLLIKAHDIPHIAVALGVDISALFQEPREEKAV